MQITIKKEKIFTKNTSISIFSFSSNLKLEELKILDLPSAKFSQHSRSSSLTIIPTPKRPQLSLAIEKDVNITYVNVIDSFTH